MTPKIHMPFLRADEMPASGAEEVTRARLAAARANGRWKEIAPPVKRGRLYVDADTDAVYARYRAAVFGVGSVLRCMDGFEGKTLDTLVREFTQIERSDDAS